MRPRRALSALLLGVLSVAASWVPAAAGADARAGAVLEVDVSASGTAATQPAAVDPCKDKGHNAGSERWTGTFEWSFDAASTPNGLDRVAVRRAIERGIGNITGAHNDCGRADHVSATADYLGTTARRANVTSDPGCALRDGHNVMDFGNLPSGVLASTCWWFINDQIVEADIRFNRHVPWATSLAGCVNSPMLEAVATHEAGHAFGLRHVSEANHPHLTMSPVLDGVCENGESTLGLGDMLGLEVNY